MFDRWPPTAAAQEQVYLAISPAQFNLVHPPKFMDVFCQLVADVLQMGRKNNLQIAHKQNQSVNLIVYVNVSFNVQFLRLAFASGSTATIFKSSPGWCQREWE